MATSRICSIENCSNTHLARGWCRAHYLRWFRHGDPLAGGTMYGEPQKYFHEVVLQYDGDECLIWPYGTSNGYGTMNVDGAMRVVARLVCEEEYGPPPTSKHEAAHACGRGDHGCVTKNHLRWDTRAGNFADKIEHGTSGRGERSNLAKLTERQVLDIRRLGGSITQRDLAARYGVDQSTISDIIRRKSWFWL